MEAVYLGPHGDYVRRNGVAMVWDEEVNGGVPFRTKPGSHPIPLAESGETRFMRCIDAIQREDEHGNPWTELIWVEDDG